MSGEQNVCSVALEIIEYKVKASLVAQKINPCSLQLLVVVKMRIFPTLCVLIIVVEGK